MILIYQKPHVIVCTKSGLIRVVMDMQIQFMVAEVDRRVAGFISCHLAEGNAGNVGLISVLPEHQGIGLG